MSDFVFGELYPTANYLLEIRKGNIQGHRIFNSFGERENIATTTNGEDIWRGIATSVPIPVDIGEQMEVVSSDLNDTLNGTGVKTLKIHYIDATGNEQSLVVDMNGITPVVLNVSNIRFVQNIHSLTVGSNGVSHGNITIYKQGSSSTIYNLIEAGGNMSLTINRMVPLNKTLYLTNWGASEAQGKRAAYRLRSTDQGGIIIPKVFTFKSSTYLSLMASPTIPVQVKIPALSIVKVSAWAIVSGGEGSAYFEGVLVDD